MDTGCLCWVSTGRKDGFVVKGTDTVVVETPTNVLGRHKFLYPQNYAAEIHAPATSTPKHSDRNNNLNEQTIEKKTVRNNDLVVQNTSESSSEPVL